MSCNVDSGLNLPELEIHIAGKGDEATRMDKRLRCAGRALGVKLRTNWLPGDYNEARAYVAGRLLSDRLRNTEEFENLLRPYVEQAQLNGKQ